VQQGQTIGRDVAKYEGAVVTAERTWRDTAGRVGFILFIADVLAYLAKLIVFKALYKKHVDLLVIWAWIGLAISILAPVLAVIGMRKRFSIMVSLVSIALAFLWITAIAWWVMVK
jgi:hypothetical protein